MVKKRNVVKSKKNNNSAYFEYKSILGSSNKFWRIVKDGTKITTQYGRIGTLGQMTTKDYGSKVDNEYDKLIQSKKKKGYVEGIDLGDKKPKPPTSIQREFLKVCKKAQDNPKLNPGSRNFDCEGQLDSYKGSDSELKWQIEWNKDALKKGEFDWDKLNEHEKSKRKKKKTQKGGGKDLLTKLQIKNMQRLKQCESKAKNKSQKKKCSNEFNKTWNEYSKFLNKNAIRKVRHGADRRKYTPKQQREIMKQFFGKDQKSPLKGGRKLKKIKKRSHIKTKMNNSRGKNKALENLWTDMSNMKKYVYIMKDGSYQIKSLMPSYKGQRGSDFHHKYCLPMIEKANNDDSVKAILTAGNSFDGYRQLYEKVGSSSVNQVLKDYKKYWKYQIDRKLYTC